MNRSYRSVGRLLLAATALLVVTLTSASAALAAGVPTCRAGSQPGTSPVPACVHTSYVSDSYVTPLVRSSFSMTHKIVGHGRNAYVTAKLKIGFSDALKECPGGGVPFGLIPCQEDSAVVGTTGEYVRGHAHLLTSDLPGTYQVCTQQVPVGTCTINWRFSAGQYKPGYHVYVVGVGVGELTQNPAGDLGDAGFEFSVGITIPKP